MNRPFSIYLDLVRFLAALLVAIHHSSGRSIVLDGVPFSGYGNSAVMVFFVLSGYVIAYVADTKETTVRQYAVSRMARIYPVAIAAVLITLVLDLIGKSVSMEYYQTSPHDLWFIRLVSSLMFTNELWFVSIQSFSNVPYWSLNFEVWYYVIFGAFIFSPPKWRLPLCLGLLLLVGPKIALLFPIWLVGAYTYHRARKWPIGEAAAWVLFIGSFAGIWLYHELEVTRVMSHWLLAVIGPHWHHELTSSQFFMGHFVLALIMAANFLGVLRLADRLGPLLRLCEKPIRFLAAYTFTLYLLHMPLIKFFATVIDGDPHGYSYYAMVMGSVFLAVLVVGTYTERRKNAARDWLNGIWDRVASVYARSRGSIGRDLKDVD